jgi:hypothetical protein
MGRGAALARTILILAALAQLGWTPSAAMADLVLVNRDDPGEGFNDPTPAAPVGGNPGTTIGEQRLIAFQRAIDLWSQHLTSPVDIRIAATFDELECNSSSVTLGMAGPFSVFRDFAGAPVANTYYPAALADRLAGRDLAPDEEDIEAIFNSTFGTTCAFPAGWYYGLDAAPRGDDSDLVTVVLHELGHGFGFLTLIDVRTGGRFDNRDDIYMTFLLDDRTGDSFSEMTNGQRRSATTSTTHLKWFGSEVVAASGSLNNGADGSGRVEIYAPADPIEGSSLSHWSDRLGPNELMEPFLTQPIHDVGLAAELLGDIGWTADVFCQADCDGSRLVTIEELINSVRILLGAVPVTTCAAVDADLNGAVTVDELVGAVGRALGGCPA